MKKILIIANSDGGLFKFRKELLESLLLDNEVYLASPEGIFTDALITMGCKFLRTDIDRKSTNFIKEIRLFIKYNEIVQTVQPDCVLTYTIKPNIYGGLLCSLKKIPYIANITGLGSVFNQQNLFQKIIVLLYRCSLRKAKKVFFQNEANMAYMLSNKMVGDSYDLLPGSGVNLQQYLPREYPNNEVVDFLFVSRIMKEKGIDQYIEAASTIRAKYPNTRFHVCGRCEKEYTEVIQKLHEEGIIIYHGMVMDMLPMYQMCSCTVHPTYYPEGMSNVILESCASARPVITTNISGCKEIVDDGINGFLCNPKDAQSLIINIEKFLALDWKTRCKMGLCGRQKVESEFDRKIVVNKYIGEIHYGQI